MVYYGPLDNCPVCGGKLECGRSEYYCTGAYSEWSTCTFNTREPPRKEEPLVLPEFIKETPVYDVLLPVHLILCVYICYLLNNMH